jgi:hypothetical protein
VIPPPLSAYAPTEAAEVLGYPRTVSLRMLCSHKPSQSAQKDQDEGNTGKRIHVALIDESKASHQSQEASVLCLAHPSC